MLLLSVLTVGILAWVVAVVGLIEGIIYLTKTDEELESELQKKLERYMGSALVVEDAEEVEEEEYDNMRALDDAWDREPDEDDLIREMFGGEI